MLVWHSTRKDFLFEVSQVFFPPAELTSLYNGQFNLMYHYCSWRRPFLVIKQDTSDLFKRCQGLNEVLKNVGLMN